MASLRFGRLSNIALQCRVAVASVRGMGSHSKDAARHSIASQSGAPPQVLGSSSRLQRILHTFVPAFDAELPSTRQGSPNNSLRPCPLPPVMHGVWLPPSGANPAEPLSSQASDAAQTEPQPIVELRTYKIVPETMKAYIDATRDNAAVRKELNPGWLGFWTTETGGCVNEVKHMYSYPGGMEQRDAVRQHMAQSPAWAQEYLPKVKACFQEQHSAVFVPAADCMAAASLPGVSKVTADVPYGDKVTPGVAGGGAVFEFRKYELVAGYHTMPAFKKALMEGRLNVFLEVWRHGSTAACLAARQGARGALEWRKTIADVAPLTISFETQILRPTSFSPWK